MTCTRILLNGTLKIVVYRGEMYIRGNLNKKRKIKIYKKLLKNKKVRVSLYNF